MAATKRNPPLVIFNPGGRAAPAVPRGWTRIASDVQAICYVHAKDGKCYVHGFGNHDPSEEELASGVLRMKDLKMRTDVEAFWSPDGSQVLLRQKHGKKIVKLFD